MMSCTGNRDLATPALDRLAGSGVSFTRAYCTNPLCVPSRFSLMTGRMPSEVGVRGNEEAPGGVPAEIKRQGLGWILGKQGYDAVYAGKVHLPGITPEELGFEFLCDGHERRELVDTCCEYLGRPHRRPFLMVASFINPHDICYMVCRTFETPEQLTAKYSRLPSGPAMFALDKVMEPLRDMERSAFIQQNCPRLPDNFAVPDDEPEAVSRMLGGSLRGRARGEWTEEDFRLYRWVYARLTEVVDAEIGEVLGALERGGLTGNTVVIFTSDHGDMNGAHRMEQKVVFYEESVRVPMVVSWPGRTPPGACVDQALVSNGLDIYPTICELAGAEIPVGHRGRSLVALLDGTVPLDWRDHLPIESAIGNAVVTRTQKYERYAAGARNEQLRDLRVDPGETRNHLHDAENAGVAEILRERYAAIFSAA